MANYKTGCTINWWRPLLFLELSFTQSYACLLKMKKSTKPNQGNGKNIWDQLPALQSHAPSRDPLVYRPNNSNLLKQPIKQQVRRPQDRPHCNNCGSFDHFARDCRTLRTESNGRTRDMTRIPASAKIMLTAERHSQDPQQKTGRPLNFLASSSSELGWEF